MAQKIMIVEDNAWIARVWATRLANEGFDVVVAMSGEEAIEKVRTDRPDLILLDIMMPGMGGFEVCQRLKISRDTSAIPIIFLSGFGNLEERRRAAELGADGYFVKSDVKAEELLQALRRVLSAA